MVIGFFSVWDRINAILLAPLRDFDILWTLLPIYINWILLEYYPERKETPLGNVFINGFSAIWVGMSWIRYIYHSIAVIEFVLIRIIVSIGMIGWGFFLMREAIEGRSIAKYFGKARIVCFLTIIFTPFIYEAIGIDKETLIAILFIFLGMCFLSWFLKRVLPEPKHLRIEKKGLAGEFEEFEEALKAEKEVG
jgi:hypothetical protein